MATVRPIVVDQGIFREYRDTDILLGTTGGGGSLSSYTFDTFEVVDGELVLTKSVTSPIQSQVITDGELVLTF